MSLLHIALLAETEAPKFPLLLALAFSGPGRFAIVGLSPSDSLPEPDDTVLSKPNVTQLNSTQLKQL